MADLGEGTLCPLLFLDQTGQKHTFGGGTGPPLSKVLDDPPPISRSGFGTAVGLHTKSGLGN